jgi:hypothetical protein
MAPFVGTAPAGKVVRSAKYTCCQAQSGRDHGAHALMAVLLDVATEDPRSGAWSAEALAQAADRSILVINPIVFAQVSVGFDRREDLEEALPPELYRRDALPYEAAFLAGKSFIAYRRRGGRRAAPLPGCYIGAHAAGPPG